MLMQATHHLTLLAFVALQLAASTAPAQTIYRIVGADGSITFSDKPLNEGATKVPSAAGTSRPNSESSAEGLSALPYELRQLAIKHPVVLYSSANCSPCDKGRQLLKVRGIPFTEKSVSNNEDIDALKRLTADTSLPVLTVGKNKVSGVSESEWSTQLDSAGYPQKSALPAHYRFAPATPLVAPQKPVPQARPATTEAAADKRPEPSAQPAPPPTRSPANPAGITF
jgi:glutaredoxin